MIHGAIKMTRVVLSDEQIREMRQTEDELVARVAKLEAAIREAHRALAASYGNAMHAFNVLGAALAKTSNHSEIPNSSTGDK